MLSTILHPRALYLAACLGGLAMDAGAARGTLQLDGILAVRSDRGVSARMIVMPTGGEPMVREHVAGKFSLELPLDGTYLLSFEREGLVTKQIYFDTSVPVERHQETMSFPFKVTLFPEGKDGIYAYAGPVGIVRYAHEKNDFDYEVDYTLRPGAPMAGRIMALVKRMEQRGADGLPMRGGAVRYTASVPGGADAATSASSREADAATMGQVADAQPDDIPRAVNETQVGPAAPLVASTNTTRRRALPEPRIIRLNGGAVPETPAEPLPEEELIVQRQRVITIVRVTEVTGHVSEYRRVADRNGQVVHFRDGVQIPEPVYRERTGR